MKKFIVIALILLLLFAATHYIFYVPPRTTGYLGVTYSGFGPQTNAGGQIVYMVGISNGGPCLIYAGAGTESSNGQYFSYNFSVPEPLKPGDQTVVPVALPGISPQLRITAYSQKVYSPGWRGNVAWLIEIYILKRAVYERAYPVKPKK